MSFETAKAQLEALGYGDRIRVLDQSSATVALAAEALHCLPEEIAKSLSFLQGEEPVIIVVCGTARIDNHKYKQRFHLKAKMIPGERVEELTGHVPGGVTPFGVKAGVTIWLDESLRRFETVYPACGSCNTAIVMTVAELEKACGAAGWVDVCKVPEPVAAPEKAP